MSKHLAGVSGAVLRQIAKAYCEHILESRLKQVTELLLSDQFKQGGLEWISTHVVEELHACRVVVLFKLLVLAIMTGFHVASSMITGKGTMADALPSSLTVELWSQQSSVASVEDPL